MAQSVQAQLEAVNRVLFEQWDPIGVNSDPQLIDEYASFAPLLLDKVRQGVGVEALADVLGSIAQNHLGLAIDAKRDTAAAKALIAIQC